MLIGDATLSMDFLTRHPNVHHLDFRPYQEIPELGADFDVSIMPWLHNDWTRNCNPIKLKEYLSLGQEVVTTGFIRVSHSGQSPQSHIMTDLHTADPAQISMSAVIGQIVVSMRKEPGGEPVGCHEDGVKRRAAASQSLLKGWDCARVGD